MPIIRFFMLFLTLNSFQGHAQNPDPRSYHTQQYTDENGLPQNSVKSLAVDESGYLWLATEDGLTRFDGQNFFTYTKTTTGTRSHRIRNIIRNLNDNALYGQTEYHELIPISKGKASSKSLRYDQAFSYTNTSFKSFDNLAQELPDQDHAFPIENFLIRTTVEKHYMITKDSLTCFHKNNIARIAFKNDGKRGFFVLNKLLFHFDKKGNFTVFDDQEMKPISLRGDFLKEKYISQKGLKIYWNSNTEQVFIYHNNTFFTLNYTNQGLETTSIINNFDFDKRKIITAYYDELNKRLFLGSHTQGLFVIQLPIFYSETYNKNVETITSYAQHSYNDHSTLFANGNLLYSDGQKSELPLVNQYSNNFSLVIDHDKNIWTQKDSSIYKLSPKGDKILERYNLPFKTSCLYLDHENTLWIGTEEAVYSKNLKTSDLAPVLITRLNGISYLHKQNNILWIGTFTGLYQYNTVNKSISALSQMANMQIRSIYNRANELWITTYGDGFYLYKHEQLTKMPLDRDHYLNSSHCILEDPNGFFWINTNKGLFQASIPDLLAFEEGKTDQVFYLYYDKKFGFKTNEFNGGCQPCATIQEDGTFVLPSLIGSVMFNPTFITPELPNKILNIDRITIDSLEIEAKDTIKAKADFERLEIQISSPYFGNPNNLNFDYKLGDKNQWTNVNEDQVISFSTLPHGSHKLLIRKSNGFNYGNFEYRNLVIQVSPFYYQTWWFRSVLTLLLMGVIMYISRAKYHNTLKRNKLLENLVINRTADLEKSILDLQCSQELLKEQTIFQKRLIAAITHDIKSPLKYLMVTSRHLYHKEDINGPIKDSIRAIYISSSDMFHFTDNLLNYSKLFLNKKKIAHKAINLKELIIDKTSIFSEIVMHNRIRINNYISPDLSILSEKTTLSVILHNLVDNAIKFSPNGVITFNAEKTENSLVISIQDTGCGMCPKILDWLNGGKSEDEIEGLGLKMVKSLSSGIRISIEAESTLGEGTHIKLIFNQPAAIIQDQNKTQLSAQIH